MFFKTFTLLLIVGAACCFDIPDSIKVGLEKVHRECMAKTNALLDHIHKCSEKAIPDDPDAKCYLACFHDQLALDLKAKILKIQTVDHAISDDMHDVLDHVNKECDGAYFDKIGGCEGAWQKTNCHLQAHHDVQHFCELLKSFN